MAGPIEARKAELVDRVAAAARAQRPRDRAAEQFARRFYASVPIEDLAAEAVDALAAAALAFWDFAQDRPPGAPKIRIFNPRAEEHGYASRRTVVEIVNDDMPFLVDSVTMELNRRGLVVLRVIHPVLRVAREGGGGLRALHAPHEAPADARSESFMHVEVDALSGGAALEETKAGLAGVLADVRAAVDDWPAMRGRLAEILTWLYRAPPPCPGEEIEEAKAFLSWIDNDHFTFLGYRDYDLSGVGDAARLEVVPGSGLGVLRDADERVFQGRRDLALLPVAVQQFLRAPMLLSVNKATRRSTVHRPSSLDVIMIRKLDPNGVVTGERLFVGLFTSSAYSAIPHEVPLLRRKVAVVMARSGFDPAGHDGKALLHVLDTYPRDELLQIDADELYDCAIGILRLQGRQRIALFARRDPFGRFVSCLVFVPRDRYSPELCARFGRILEQAYSGTIASLEPDLGTETMLARIHFVVTSPTGTLPEIGADLVEARLVEAARSWRDMLRDALIAAHGEDTGFSLFRRYADAFTTDYRERFNHDDAVFDIGVVEAMLETGQPATHLYRPADALPAEIRLKIYNAGATVALSDVLPVLEDMGLRVLQEMPFRVEPRDADWIAVHDFAMVRADGGAIDLEHRGMAFEQAFARIWSGAIEADGFNRLVLLAGLDWREVVVLRAYARYLRQVGIPFSQAYMAATLARHPDLARLLVELFLARLDPAAGAGIDEAIAGVREGIERRLDAVDSLDEDRIIRRFANLIESTERTNYFRRDAAGEPKSYLAVKLDSRRLDELPEPRPLCEIWVYSPRMEGIHLRGGRVARGGIRWSDRREDFRTEILELMKTQMVKNTVIVPVGSKGGFVVKRPPAGGGRDALGIEVVECYRLLMRGLLDLTDNIEEGRIVPPPGVRRLDGDDPYLVVAADKGTASFSDIANAVSRDEYGFWLDDAFASGGSAGYDHKRMGITARGAWEGVKRHFREMGRDIQREPFTVVGVGDMSGDVFGNGMLLSPEIRLLGAFNHLHIFVDPAPDPAASLAERRRLYDRRRSSWADYDRSLIGPGGGVFERTAKSIPVSPEMRSLFGLTRDRVAPMLLIQALLRAPVDLLWLGGIGTYVKAAAESHAAVGDRSNDGLRVDAEELRCKVIGEGANLGVTQRGRIALALAGGRINTDAIDNSAGVDTSDHEVNIKILLGDVVARGELTLAARDRLLAAMTDEVAAQVLRDNYLQTLALSVAEAEGPVLLDRQALLMRRLERGGLLSRALEALPDDEALAERASANRGLTRPELATLMAYGKIDLNHQLLASDLPDDPAFAGDLAGYFPAALRRDYLAAIERHRLRREIIATHVTNSLINRAGPTFVSAMEERTGRSAPDIARAYTIARAVLDLRTRWAAIEALDNRLPAATQIAMLVEIRHAVERVAAWFLLNGGTPLDIGALGTQYRAGLDELAARLDRVMDAEGGETIGRRAATLGEAGVPAPLARWIAGLQALVSGCDIVRMAAARGFAVEAVGRAYFALGARFGIDWLRAAAAELPPAGHWQKLAVASIVDDLYLHQVELTARVLVAAGRSLATDNAIQAWIAPRAAAVQQTEGLIAEMRAAGRPDLAMLTVAGRRLRALVAS